MKAWTLTGTALSASALILLFTGCSQSLKKNPAKEEAKARWEQMRAKVRLQLADRNFESGQVDDAFNLCQEVLSLDPANVDGYLLMCRIHLEKGRIAEAESVLDVASGLGQPSPDLAYLRGMLAEHREKREDACAWYKQAYEAKPNEVDYLVAYAESLLATEDLNTAVDVLTKRGQDFEQDLRVQILLGQALSMAGQYREASDAYLSVMRLAPNNPQLREEAGLSLLAAGRLDEAQSVLEPLIKSAKDKPSVSAVQAYAAIMLQANQPERAISMLDGVAGNDARSFPLWLLLGKAYLTVDQVAKAKDAAQRACKLQPKSVEAQLLLACCDLAAGNRTQAFAAAQDIVAAHPDDPVAISLLQKAVNPEHD